MPNTRNNTYRFMPARVSSRDNLILFNSLRYSETAMVSEKKGFKVGIGIGPEQGLELEQGADPEGAGDRLILQEGSRIIPAVPNEELKPVPVRKHEKTGRQFVDWATFQKIGDKLFAVPYKEDQVVYVEVWTGDWGKKPKAETKQFIQASVFNHGSVAYAGGEIVINAPSVRSAKSTDEWDDAEPNVNTRTSQAELVSERRGDVIGGVPLWIARMWRIRYSATDTEMILVRQLNRFWWVFVEDGVLTYREIKAEKAKNYERQFENRTVDQRLIPVPGQDTAASVAA